MHPQEFLALVAHAHQAAETRVSGFEQRLELAQRRALRADYITEKRWFSMRNSVKM